MNQSLPRLATIGEIARALGVSLHRVQYVIHSRKHIRARAIAGAARCFDDNAIAQIRHEINAIDARRQRKGVAHE